MRGEQIAGGYYLKARKIQQSDISTCSPAVREIWDWLLMNANHKNSRDGRIKRGQLFRTYEDIREGLKWYVGYRKERYSEDVTKKAMKALRRHGMITTTKAPGGVLITICNYDFYQNPKNYEGTNEGTNEGTAKAPSRHQGGTTYKNKNEKNVKNEKKKPVVVSVPETLNTTDFLTTWETFQQHRKQIKKPMTDLAKKQTLENLTQHGPDVAIKMLKQSIANGWQGVFDLKGGANGNRLDVFDNWEAKRNAE